MGAAKKNLCARRNGCLVRPARRRLTRGVVNRRCVCPTRAVGYRKKDGSRAVAAGRPIGRASIRAPQYSIGDTYGLAEGGRRGRARRAWRRAADVRAVRGEIQDAPSRHSIYTPKWLRAVRIARSRPPSSGIGALRYTQTLIDSASLRFWRFHRHKERVFLSGMRSDHPA